MTPALRDEARRAVQVLAADGRPLLAGGRASLFVLETIGWHPRAVRHLARWPGVWAVDLGYRLVAANRDLAARFLFRGEDERRARGPTDAERDDHSIR